MKTLQEKLNTEFDDLLENGNFEHLLTPTINGLLQDGLEPRVSRSDFLSILKIGAIIALEHQQEMINEETRFLLNEGREIK